jgi:hypothetical protein
LVGERWTHLNPSPFFKNGEGKARGEGISTPSFDYKIHPSRGEYDTINI